MRSDYLRKLEEQAREQASAPQLQSRKSDGGGFNKVQFSRLSETGSGQRSRRGSESGDIAAGQAPNGVFSKAMSSPRVPSSDRNRWHDASGAPASPPLLSFSGAAAAVTEPDGSILSNKALLMGTPPRPPSRSAGQVEDFSSPPSSQTFNMPGLSAPRPKLMVSPVSVLDQAGALSPKHGTPPNPSHPLLSAFQLAQASDVWPSNPKPLALQHSTSSGGTPGTRSPTTSALPSPAACASSLLAQHRAGLGLLQSARSASSDGGSNVEDHLQAQGQGSGVSSALPTPRSAWGPAAAAIVAGSGASSVGSSMQGSVSSSSITMYSSGATSATTASTNAAAKVAVDWWRPAAGSGGGAAVTTTPVKPPFNPEILLDRMPPVSSHPRPSSSSSSKAITLPRTGVTVGGLIGGTSEDGSGVPKPRRFSSAGPGAGVWHYINEPAVPRPRTTSSNGATPTTIVEDAAVVARSNGNSPLRSTSHKSLLRGGAAAGGADNASQNTLVFLGPSGSDMKPPQPPQPPAGEHRQGMISASGRRTSSCSSVPGNIRTRRYSDPPDAVPERNSSPGSAAAGASASSSPLAAGAAAAGVPGPASATTPTHAEQPTTPLVAPLAQILPLAAGGGAGGRYQAVGDDADEMSNTSSVESLGVALERGGLPAADASSPKSAPRGGSRLGLHAPNSPTGPSSPGSTSSGGGSPLAASMPAAIGGGGGSTTLMGIVKNRFRASMASMPLKMLGSSKPLTGSLAAGTATITAVMPFNEEEEEGEEEEEEEERGSGREQDRRSGGPARLMAAAGKAPSAPPPFKVPGAAVAGRCGTV